MFIFKLICVAVPIALIIFGGIVAYLSSKEGAADVRGPGEAFGLLLVIAGVAICVLELLIVVLWKVFSS